jgi:hypothetical protein
MDLFRVLNISTRLLSSTLLKEETQDLASEVLPPGLLVIHDAAGGSHDNEAEKDKEK